MLFAGIRCKSKSPISRIPVPSPSSSVSFISDNPQIANIVSLISADSIRSYVETLANFHTRNTNSDTVSMTEGIGAARRWIFDRFKSISRMANDRLQVSYHDFTDVICGGSGLHRNVIALLPGTVTPDIQIVVGGHYDSRTTDRCDDLSFAPGANDDGSGVAGVIELARVMSQYNFASTIVFAAFTGEEQGLFGSRHYATEANFAGDKIIAMITNDIIGNIEGGSGTIDSVRVRCFSDDPNESPHRQLARYAKMQGEAYLNNFTVEMILARDRPGRGGDHLAFYENGFTAIRFTEPEDNLTRQHNPNDLIDFMSFTYCRKVVQINAALLANLAGAPQSPAGLEIESTLVDRFKISWEAQPGLEYILALRGAESSEYDTLIYAGQDSQIEISDIEHGTFASLAAIDNKNDESLFSNEILVRP